MAAAAGVEANTGDVLEGSASTASTPGIVVGVLCAVVGVVAVAVIVVRRRRASILPTTSSNAEEPTNVVYTYEAESDVVFSTVKQQDAALY